MYSFYVQIMVSENLKSTWMQRNKKDKPLIVNNVYFQFQDNIVVFEYFMVF
jgi:hypothetical protein